MQSSSDLNRPDGFDYPTFNRLFAAFEPGDSISKKIDSLSQSLLGVPYLVSPLVGSNTEAEKFTIPLDAFDCDTFVETVLAVVLSTSVETFFDRLIDLRYGQGQVEWLDRNHYKVDWISRNEAKGYVKNVTPEQGSVAITRELSILPDYPVRTHTIHFFPFANLSSVTESLQTGDLVFFGTTRENLDVAHMGIIINRDQNLSLRHSAKSKGGVIEEDLGGFLERFGGSPGGIFVRPVEPA